MAARGGAEGGHPAILQVGLLGRTATGEEVAGGLLGALDVGLVEGVDAEDGAGQILDRRLLEGVAANASPDRAASISACR